MASRRNKYLPVTGIISGTTPLLSFDTVTRQEHDAQVTTAGRATAVLAALANPVTVKVLDDTGTVKGQGTMNTPWAIATGNILTFTDTSDFDVLTSGTPNTGWRLRFESGSRWIQGSFGLIGSGQDFLWSKSTWDAAQVGRFGTASTYAYKSQTQQDGVDTFNVADGSQVVFGWKNTNIQTLGDFQTGVGGQYDLKQDANIPLGTNPQFTITSTPVLGIVVDPQQGLLSVASYVAEANYTVVVDLVPEVTQQASVDRDTFAYLFQQAPPQIDARLTPGNNFGYDHTATNMASESMVQGPSWRCVERHVDWLWTTPGGDWLDSALTVNGSVAWASKATPIGTAGIVYAHEMTGVAGVLNYVFANNKWAAFCLFGGNAPRVMATHRYTDTTKRPYISGSYTDGSTFNLACRLVAVPNTTSPYSVYQNYPTAQIPTSGSNTRFFIEFEKPTKAVQSASFFFWITEQQWSGSNTNIDIRGVLNPPTRNSAVLTGAASIAGGTKDSGLVGNTNVIWLHRYLDGVTQDNFVSSYWPSLVDQDFSPEFWGGSVDTNKLPYTHAGKFVRANNPTPTLPTNQENLTKVESTYAGEGFVPLTPGLGALRTHLTGSAVVDGQVTGNSGAVFCNGRLHLPASRIGLQGHLRIRYYQRTHLDPVYNPMTPQNRKHIWHVLNSASRWTDRAGKAGIGATHDTKSGGFSGSSGGPYGWQMRDSWYLCDANLGGPNEGGIALGYHLYDFLGNNPVGHRYGANDHGLGERYGQRGGYGGVMAFDRWYLVEKEIYLNTVTGVTYPSYIADGYLRTWIDGRLCYESTNMVFRQLPYNTDGFAQGGQYATPMRELGIREVILNAFHGGQSNPTENMTQFYTGLVVADGALGYIGPMVLS